MKKLKALFRWFTPFIPLFTIIAAFTIIVPVTYSYVPQFTKYIFDYVLGEKSNVNTLPKPLLDLFNSYTKPLEAVTIVVISLVIFQIFRGALMFLNGYFKGLYAESIAYNIRNKMYQHIQDLSFTYHNNVDNGDLIQRSTSDIETIKNFISLQLPEILYIFTCFISAAVQMGQININIMYISICIVPINFTASIIYFSYVEKQFTKIEKHEAKMTSVLEENIGGVRIVKAFNQELNEIERFDKHSKFYRDESQKLNTSMAMYWGFLDGLSMIQYAVTVFYCIYLRQNVTSISVGDITACLSYVSFLIYPTRGLGRILSDFGKALVSAGRIDEVLKIEDEYKSNGTLKPTIEGKIVFDNMSFKFHDSTEESLKYISFSINKGETVAFVGKTGSGKSTIANILERLIDYTSGHVYIDGVELKDIEKHYLRSQVGIILQEPFLYSKSVLENITIGDSNKTMEDAVAASKVSCVYSDIMNFEHQFQTMVSEKGTSLSGGQKQRIAIARMVILNKPIIIFDDSLSAVDTQTDQSIRDHLKKNSKATTIIITHRITTAKQADKIVVLEDGQITGIGTHDELVKTNDLYSNLWSIQGNLEEQFTNLIDGGTK